MGQRIQKSKKPTQETKTRNEEGKKKEGQHNELIALTETNNASNRYMNRK